MKRLNSAAIISIDAKRKSRVGESDFLIASVSLGKVVIVRKNKKFKVCDHYFSKVSVISDAIQVHAVLEESHKEDGKNTGYNKNPKK